MTVVLQPPGEEGEGLCGQACLATACGISLEEAKAAIGHGRKSGTGTGDMIRGLRAVGIGCADRLTRRSGKRSLPVRAMLVVYQGPADRSGHWVLLWDGAVYDPAGGMTATDRITSYLEIYA